MATDPAPSDISVQKQVWENEAMQVLTDLTGQLEAMIKAVEELTDKHLGTVGWERVELTAEAMGIW